VDFAGRSSLLPRGLSLRQSGASVRDTGATNHRDQRKTILEWPPRPKLTFAREQGSGVAQSYKGDGTKFTNGLGRGLWAGRCAPPNRPRWGATNGGFAGRGRHWQSLLGQGN